MAGRLRTALGSLAVLVVAIVLVLAALEGVCRFLAPDTAGWYAVGPQRLQFLRDRVRRNSDGFRDREFVRERLPGVKRVLAVGDSFTFGDSIDRVEDAWPRVLEDRLRARGIAVEVYNLGIPGTNTAFQRDLLREKGYTFQPDEVVVGFVLNDPEPSRGEQRAANGGLLLPLLPSRVLDASLTRASYFYAWLRGRVNLLLERTGAKDSYSDFVHGLYRDGPTWTAFVETARGLVADARTHGASVTVALFPMFHDLESDPFAAETEKAAAVFREAGAEVLDLREAYRGIPTATLSVSPTDAHPNEKAHRLAGEAIAARLAASLR